MSHRPCLGKGGPFARPLSLVAHEGLDLLLGPYQARRVPGTAHHGAGTRETGTCGQPERGARAREAAGAGASLLAALVRLAPRDRLSPLSPGGPGGARIGGGGVGVSSRHSFDARALHRPTFSASPWRTLVADGLCAGACAGVYPLAQNMHKTPRKEGGVHPGDASTTPWCSASLHRCADRRGACSLAITRWRITPPPHGGRRWKTQP